LGPPPPEVVNPESSNSFSSESSDGVHEIIKVSFNSDSDDSVDFESEIEVEPEVENRELGVLEFEDPKLDKSRKKMRIERYNI
jgi:hypothetical protein